MKANKKRKLLNDEKANTAAAVMSVILLIVGFAVAGLLFTFTQVLGGQTYNLVEDDIDAITSYTDANHTFTADNTTWVDLGNTTLRNVVLYNSSYSDNTSDFSINTTTGYVLLVSDNASLNGTTITADYEYDDGDIRNAIKAGILSNFEAQQQIGDYLPIVALAIIITIVISLIISGIVSKFAGPGGLTLYNDKYGNVF